MTKGQRSRDSKKKFKPSNMKDATLKPPGEGIGKSLLIGATREAGSDLYKSVTSEEASPPSRHLHDLWSKFIELINSIELPPM